MARALIVGCGCRGRSLAAELAGRGWLVRGTSRTDAGVAAIEAAGHEAAAADPDRPGTLLDLVGDVSALVWLMGSAGGDPARLADLHGTRFESLLEKLVDTPVRIVAYERGGTVPAKITGVGSRLLAEAGERWSIRTVVLAGAPAGDAAAWATEAADRIEARLLG